MSKEDFYCYHSSCRWKTPTLETNSSFVCVSESRNCLTCPPFLWLRMLSEKGRILFIYSLPVTSNEMNYLHIYEEQYRFSCKSRTCLDPFMKVFYFRYDYELWIQTHDLIESKFIYIGNHFVNLNYVTRRVKTGIVLLIHRIQSMHYPNNYGSY